MYVFGKAVCKFVFHLLRLVIGGGMCSFAVNLGPALSPCFARDGIRYQQKTRHMVALLNGEWYFLLGVDLGLTKLRYQVAISGV